MAYVIRRVLRAIWLVVGVSLLSFTMLALTPGDFFIEMKLNPTISPESVAALRQQHGLDASLHVRYARWVGSVASGDFGYSFAYNTPVSSLLWPRVANTLILTVPATVLAWAMALGLGMWTAARRGRWPDRVCGLATSSLLTVPDLLIALLLLLVALRTGWFPTGGMRSAHSQAGSSAAIADVAHHAALPIVALVLGIMPTLLRHVRTSMSDALDAPAVQAARGHGLSRLRVLQRHALPLAANPLLSLAGLSLGGLLSASLLVEAIMGWPGLGTLLLEAILARDVFTVIGAVVLSTALLAAGNLATDTALLLVDPRIRTD